MSIGQMSKRQESFQPQKPIPNAPKNDKAKLETPAATVTAMFAIREPGI